MAGFSPAILFNTINFNHLKGDVYGGLTAAVVSLPMALAFGVASGAGPAAGLYGAVFVGLFAALFGGTRTLISEPTGPMTVVMTAVLTTLIADNPDNGLAMAFTVVMMAGMFQVALGVLKLGRYITLMPYSVISGFMSGIGIILIILQIAPLLGQDTPAGGVNGIVSNIPSLIGNIQWHEFLLGLFTLAILFLMPKRFSRIIPAQLVALIAGTLIVFLFFSDMNFRKIGEISLGLPTLYLPTFSTTQLKEMVIDAMVLGTLGSIDALLSAMISDSLTRKEHRSNKELVGQGVGNIMSGLFGGLPGAGATMGTVVNIQAGAQTALSGVIRALVLLVVIFWAAPLTAAIPLAVLAGIAFVVGFNILDWSFVRRIREVPKVSTAIMYCVMLLTVFVDLIVAVGIGVFIANIITIEKLSKLQMQNVKTISDNDDSVLLSEAEETILNQSNDRILLVSLSGPMIFGMSKAIDREHKNIQKYDVIVLDIENVPLIDVTVSLAIENMIKDAIEAGKQVVIVKPKSKTLQTLERLGAFEDIEGTRLFGTRIEALDAALQISQ